MKTLSTALFLILSQACALAHAEPYAGEDAGGWVIKKIIPIRVTQEKPLLKIGNELDVTNSYLQLFEPSTNPKDLSDIPAYCEPGRVSGKPANPDKTSAAFSAAAGGKNKLDRLLKRKTYISLENIQLYWQVAAIHDGNAPCSKVWKNDGHLAEKGFYITKDKKTVFLFIDPYIYYFSGGYGPITGSH